MRVIEPSYEILTVGDNPMRYIEQIGRICYKSENKITEVSAATFCSTMFTNQHMAMLEHYRFILSVNRDIYYAIWRLNPHYVNISNCDHTGTFIVSGSARAFYELWTHTADPHISDEIVFSVCKIISCIIDYYDCHELFGDFCDEGYTRNYNKYDCDVIPYDILGIENIPYQEYLLHKWASVRFICDRGVSHEIVRHRDASFAQESTRYCNYSNNKFGHNVTYIRPCFLGEDSIRYNKWTNVCHYNELDYFDQINLGAKPEEARDILMTSVKTEVIMTATMKEWIHFFRLRALGTTGKPHPQMKQLALPLYEEMVAKGLIREVNV